VYWFGCFGSFALVFFPHKGFLGLFLSYSKNGLDKACCPVIQKTLYDHLVEYGCDMLAKEILSPFQVFFLEPINIFHFPLCRLAHHFSGTMSSMLIFGGYFLSTGFS